jgi:iron complex outermembrane receptor protein
VNGVTTTYPAGTVFPAIAGSPNAAFLFDRANRLTFEEGTPETKLVGTVDWRGGPWSATARWTFYDSVLVPNNSPALDYETGDRSLVDFEGRYEFPRGVTLALGVNNLFDVYPHYTPAANSGATGSVGFPSFSPFGFNGRFVYARVNVNW